MIKLISNFLKFKVTYRTVMNNLNFERANKRSNSRRKLDFSTYLEINQTIRKATICPSYINHPQSYFDTLSFGNSFLFSNLVLTSNSKSTSLSLCVLVVKFSTTIVYNFIILFQLFFNWYNEMGLDGLLQP